MWHKAPDYATFDDFKRWAAEDGLHELSSHALFQLSKTRLFGIHRSITAETIGEHPWVEEMGQALTFCVEYLFTKKKARANDDVNAHADSKTALKSFGLNISVSSDTMKI